MPGRSFKNTRLKPLTDHAQDHSITHPTSHHLLKPRSIYSVKEALDVKLDQPTLRQPHDPLPHRIQRLVC